MRETYSEKSFKEVHAIAAEVFKAASIGLLSYNHENKARESAYATLLTKGGEMIKQALLLHQLPLVTRASEEGLRTAKKLAMTSHELHEIWRECRGAAAGANVVLSICGLPNPNLNEYLAVMALYQTQQIDEDRVSSIIELTQNPLLINFPKHVFY